MSNGNSAPTHMDQIEEALEERQTPDRRRRPPRMANCSREDRRKQDRRDNRNKI